MYHFYHRQSWFALFPLNVVYITTKRRELIHDRRLNESQEDCCGSHSSVANADEGRSSGSFDSNKKTYFEFSLETVRSQICVVQELACLRRRRRKWLTSKNKKKITKQVGCFKRALHALRYY